MPNLAPATTNNSQPDEAAKRGEQSATEKARTRPSASEPSNVHAPPFSTEGQIVNIFPQTFRVLVMRLTPDRILDSGSELPIDY